MHSPTLSPGEARQIVLAAQGFRSTPCTPVRHAALHSTIERLGALQLDSVNVLVRSHYLPLFSWLGAYPCGALDELAYGPSRRTLFEYWGHEASLLPLDTYPLFRWRMDRAACGVGTWKHVAQLARDRPDLVRQVEREIRERGPLSARELSDKPRSRGPWWGWSEHKSALEYLFWSDFSRPSIRSSGTALAPNASSAFAFDSRSTRRLIAACTAITCSRSCLATGSWHASISRATAPKVCSS